MVRIALRFPRRADGAVGRALAPTAMGISKEDYRLVRALPVPNPSIVLMFLRNDSAM